MNSTMVEFSDRDRFEEALVKNLFVVLLGILINCVNSTFVVTFFKNSIFYGDPRYILYIHLVINDMIMIAVTVTLFVLSYVLRFINAGFCCVLLLVAATTHKITPLNLAGMAIERYIAICKPLHHSQICTVRRTYILIGLMWSVSVIPGLTDFMIVVISFTISFYSSHIYCISSLLYNTSYHREKNKALQVIYIGFVCIVLVYTYFGVMTVARKASGNALSAKKAQSTILLHGAQLLLCMLSYLTPYVDVVLTQFFPSFRNDIMCFNYILTNIIPRLLSPLIYGVRDQNFSKQIKSILSLHSLNLKVESSRSKPST